MAEKVRFSEFGFLYGQTLRQMGRLVLWIPLLVYGLLTLLLALIHYQIFSPVAGPLASFWINLIKPSLADAYFHYPFHLQLFPFFFGHARVALSVIVEAFLFGIFIDLLIAVYRGQKPVFAVSLGRALRRYFFLTIVWAVVIGILYLLNLYFYDFIEKVLDFSLAGSPRRQIAAGAALRGLTVVLYVPFVFLLPSIMLGAATFGRTVARALSMLARHPMVSFGIVVIPYLIGLVPNWALSQSDAIVRNFSPELVFYIAIITVILDVILNFIFLGTAVKFFMDHIEE